MKKCADCDTPKDQYGDVVCPIDGKKHGSRYKCEHELEAVEVQKKSKK